MITDANTPPSGTIRDWLDYRAESIGGEISHLFTDGDPSLTWNDLRDEASKTARYLTSLGISKGESIAIMLPNSRDAIVALFGVFVGGFRATAINLGAGAEAIGYALCHSDARFVILGTDQDTLFEQAIACHPNSIKRLAPRVSTDVDHNIALYNINPDDHALLMYTSGTTGRPKGVVHTHSSLLAGGWTTSIAHALDASDRAFCVLPIYHINGLCVTVVAPLVSGGSVVMSPKFSASRFWQDCEEYNVTWFSVVPTIISHLLHGAHDPSAKTKSHIRFGRSASAALAPEVQTAFETRFDVPIVETMGMTETAAQILSNPLPPGTRKIGSPGRAYGNEAAILSNGLTPVMDGSEGEIAVRGPNMMLEYLKNPEATYETFTAEGWLRTGDLGRIDEDGYIYVTGRLKELIIKGGENIAPREIDEALYSHSDVVEAAAFSRPCPSYGERVEAAVTIKTNARVSSDDLITICHEKLGVFKSPDRVFILDDLPKGPSGKIQRLRLAELTGDMISTSNADTYEEN